MSNDKIRSLILSPPSFLKELCIKNEEINLVCLQSDISKEECLETPIKCESNLEESLDVTGSPLLVDLQGNVSFSVCEKIKAFNLWTEEEATYVPLNISKARRYISQYYSNQNIEHLCKDLPLFVICDDVNSNSVLLGAQKSTKFLMTSKIDILGYLPNDHKLLDLDHIQHAHLLNMKGKDCKTTCVTTFKYYLYGTYIQNIRNIYDSEYFGSVCVEVKCNNKCLIKSPKNMLKNKNLILQVIAGHPSSPVHFLWTDLYFLQSYIDILSNPDQCNNPDTIISYSNRDEGDIYKSINHVVKTSFLKREIQMKFELDNIRPENFLDKLWVVLKDCNDLDTLRNCFHYFFEELTESEILIKIPNKNSSNIGEIISGILEGKLAVPTITYAQALTFLFELGAEKLKNDYQAIIKNFCPMSEEQITAQWSRLQSSLPLQYGARKTRVTVCLKSGQMDTDHNVSKLTYLGKLHIVTDLIYLVKGQTFIPDENFDYFCEKVYENYLQKSCIEDFIDLKNSPRCEFTISIDLDDDNIKNDIPISYCIQVTSASDDLEVITVYHFSKFNIFPPTIYDRYDIKDIDCNPNEYCVCKLEMHKEVI